MESLVKENARLVGLLRKVHQVSVEAYNDIIYLNGRVKELDDDTVRLQAENNVMKAKLQQIDDRQAALENISRAIKIAVNEFQKLKDQYDMELQRRQHAEQIVQVLQEKIQKLETIIKSNVPSSTAPSLNNPHLKESTQLRNELLGVHRELRESIEQYETFKNQLGQKVDSTNPYERIRTKSLSKRDLFNESEPRTPAYVKLLAENYDNSNTFKTSIASPLTPSEMAKNRLTQLKSLVGEVDATLNSSPSSGYSVRPEKSRLDSIQQGTMTTNNTLKSVPITSLDLHNTPMATTESIVSSNLSNDSQNNRINRRNSLNTQTVMRKPSISEIILHRPISPPKDGKLIQRITKFDEYFDQLQDELLALQSPVEKRP